MFYEHLGDILNRFTLLYGMLSYCRDENTTDTIAKYKEAVIWHVGTPWLFLLDADVHRLPACGSMYSGCELESCDYGDEYSYTGAIAHPAAHLDTHTYSDFDAHSSSKNTRQLAS